MRRIARDTKGHKRLARSRAGWFCALSCLAALACAAGAGLLRIHAQQSPPSTAINPPGAQASPPGARAAPSPPAGQPANQQAANTPEDARKQEIANQCANLLKMATELKTEVDKTTVDTLSVTVVRKAGQIEELAHKVRVETGKS